MALRAFKSNQKSPEESINDFFKNLPPDERVVTTHYLNIPIGDLNALKEFSGKYGVEIMEETALRISELLRETGLNFGEFRQLLLRRNAN